MAWKVLCTPALITFPNLIPSSSSPHYTPCCSHVSSLFLKHTRQTSNYRTTKPLLAGLSTSSTDLHMDSSSTFKSSLQRHFPRLVLQLSYVAIFVRIRTKSPLRGTYPCRKKPWRIGSTSGGSNSKERPPDAGHVTGQADSGLSFCPHPPHS